MAVGKGLGDRKGLLNGFFVPDVLRSFREQSEAEKPFVPLVGGPRMFVLLLYASVLVAASIEFFASQSIWYGSWELYNTYVFTVTGAFVFMGMVMLLMSTKNGVDTYGLPIPRLLLGTFGFVAFSLSGLALVYYGDDIGGMAVPLSVILLYGFLMMLLGTRGFDTHDGLRLALYGTGLVVMILVPVHEAFGVAKSSPGDYPFTLLNLLLLTSGMIIALVSVQSIQTRDGFVGAWLLGAMGIFLIAFHEQIGIVASGNYSPYDRTLAMIGIAFSFLPLPIYVWRERTYIGIWTRLRTANELIEKGDYEDALKNTDAVIRQCSRVGIEDRFALPWSVKADAHYRNKEYEKARVYYENALKIDPNDSTSWCHIGNMYAFEGKQEAALKAFDEALKHDPKNGFAWNNKGAVYQQLGMHEDALICFDKASELLADPFDAHVNMGKLFSKLGHSNDALTHFQYAQQLRPKSEVAYQGVHREFFRGMCLDQIAGWEQLGLDASYLRRILDEDPGNFVKRSKEFLRDIVDQKAQLAVLPSKEHLEITTVIQTILKATEEPGATLERIKEETNLNERDLVLPLALLVETDHVHFRTVGKNRVYVSKGKAPEVPPEPPPMPPPPPAPAPVEAPKPAQAPTPVPAVAEAAKQPVYATIKCPGCGHQIKGDEKKCPRCDLPFEGATVDCPICGEDVEITAADCAKCGAIFREAPKPAPVPAPAEAEAGAGPAKPKEKREKPKKKRSMWRRRKPQPKKELPERRVPKREVVFAEPTASVLVFKKRKK